MKDNTIRLHSLVDATAPIPTSRDGLGFADLASLMNDSPSPVVLAGDYTGRIVSLIALQRLPGMLRTPITSIVAMLARPIWRGKRFDGNTGTNLWIGRRRPRTFGDFAITTAQDGHHAALDYDQRTNPRPVRLITGEAAAMGHGVFIAAMYLTVMRRRITLMYFTLDR